MDPPHSEPELFAAPMMSRSVPSTTSFAAPSQQAGSSMMLPPMYQSSEQQSGAWPSSGHSTPPLDMVRGRSI